MSNARGRELQHRPKEWPLIWQWHSLTPFEDPIDRSMQTYLIGFQTEAEAIAYGAAQGWPCARTENPTPDYE